MDLKRWLDNHQGTYFLNLSMTDLEMVNIFGKSDRLPSISGLR